MEKLAGMIIISGDLPGCLPSGEKFCRTVIDPGYRKVSKRLSEILFFSEAQLHRDSELTQ